MLSHGVPCPGLPTGLGVLLRKVPGLVHRGMWLEFGPSWVYISYKPLALAPKSPVLLGKAGPGLSFAFQACFLKSRPVLKSLRGNAQVVSSKLYLLLGGERWG